MTFELYECFILFKRTKRVYLILYSMHYFITLQIVVVPNSAAAQKVPPVPGLLEYRKDTKKLYLRSNETWNVIGEEKKV